MTRVVAVQFVRVDKPTWAALLRAEHCETGCGRLLFTATEVGTGRRVLAELAADETADWAWTYPEHTAQTCRDWRAVADIAIPMIRDRKLAEEAL